MHPRQIKFIQDALRQKNAEEEIIKEIRKILELEVTDNEIIRDRWLHSPIINGELNPALIYSDGYKSYYNNGKRHSFIHNGELIPATICKDGSKSYYNNGEWHSFFHNGELIPAFINNKNGGKSHYNNGKLHSFLHNGELIPAISRSDGTRFYYNNGTKVDPAERMREIIAEKLLETKEETLMTVLKLLA